MTSRRRPLFLAVLVALTASALIMGATAQAQNSGNSANAKLCQKGGWQDLATSTGESFQNQGQCVSYAAKGGALSLKATPIARFQAICESGGGFFLTSDPSDHWLCGAGRAVGALSRATYLALAEPCAEAGGSLSIPPRAQPTDPAFNFVFCNF